MEKTSKKEEEQILFILGPTGIGKTFVSLNLSSKYEGTIINTDAFSLYSSLNIMTAKATAKEQEMVPHKMIDILSLNNTSYTVNQFTFEAVSQIREVFQSKRMPIVVGGTNYYLESILFEKNEMNKQIEFDPFSVNYSLLNQEVVQQIQSKILMLKNKEKNELYNEISDYLGTYSIQQLYNLLLEIDCSYANFFHKNNIRRIINVIAHYFVYNTRKSDIINSETKTLRYNTKTKVIILTTPHLNLLKMRITERINEMLKEKGGLAEIFWIFQQFPVENISFSSGILQAIGYKEFYPLYKTSIKEGCIKNIINEMMSNDTKDKLHYYTYKLYDNISTTIDLMNLYTQCTEELIKKTMKYAKYQIKWISKKILPFIKGYHIINITEFTKEAYQIYISHVEEYINSPDLKCALNTVGNINICQTKLKQWEKYYCEICNCDMNGNIERDNHYRSHKHKKKWAKYKTKH